jgi:hypothetical protein
MNHSSKSFLDKQKEKELEIISLMNYKIVRDTNKKKQFE